MRRRCTDYLLLVYSSLARLLLTALLDVSALEKALSLPLQPPLAPSFSSFSPGSYVTHETNHFVYFYIDQKAVLLFKSGKTNYTRLRSKNNLKKAHNDWLLPLRMLVGGIAAANKNDIDQHAVDTVCALNPNLGVSFIYFMCKKVLERLMFVC